MTLYVRCPGNVPQGLELLCGVGRGCREGRVGPVTHACQDSYHPFQRRIVLDGAATGGLGDSIPV